MRFSLAMRKTNFSAKAVACWAALGMAGCGSATPQSVSNLPEAQSKSSMSQIAAERGMTTSAPSTKAVPRRSWISSSAATGTLLYVSDNGPLEGIRIYNLDGNLRHEVGVIAGTEFLAPFGLSVDNQGTLWVVNQNINGGASNILAFPKGSTEPSVTLNDAGTPQTIAVGNDGKVYVQNYGGFNGGVGVYPPGSVNPTQTLTDPNGQVRAVAVDADNDVFVADNIAISEFVASGGSYAFKEIRPLPFQNYANDLEVDAAGNLVAEFYGPVKTQQSIEVFARGTWQKTAELGGILGDATGFALGNVHGKPVIVVAYDNGGAVIEYTYPGGKEMHEAFALPGGLVFPYGVAISPLVASGP